MPYNPSRPKNAGDNDLTDLLVITDVPRLRKVFTRLADDHNFRLRVTSSLEKGGEELVADKPAMVFVQTHLSGLSADILLLHLKKLLGRRRTRFVLLSPPDQISGDVLKLYHGHVDSSLGDQPLAGAILGVISGLAPAKKKGSASSQASAPDSAESMPQSAGEPVLGELPLSGLAAGDDPLLRDLSVPVVAPPPDGPVEETPEPTLEEQGVVYAPRPPIQVYSEFTGTFDSAVSSMAAPEVPVESPSIQASAGMFAQAEPDRPGRTRPRSKLLSFLLWLVPVVVIVVVVTILQYRSIQPAAVDVAAARPPVPAAKPPSAVSAPVEPKKSVPVPAPADAKPAPKAPAAESDGRMSDRAVLSAIEENRAVKPPPPTVPAANRPGALPAFIPRAGLDKSYSAANPGWERYKGVVTEFKVFRESGALKAIQVIDRGGQGVPEAFMKGVLRQVTRSPSYAVSSTEKKDGYEIQRGKAADNLKVVYYRDAEGGRLRAFVMTWQ